MPQELWIVDNGLTTALPPLKAHTLCMRVERKHTIASIAKRAVKLMAPFGKISVLHIAAHGNEANGTDAARGVSETRGGFGVALGEGLNQGNYEDLAPIADLMDKGAQCIVYACSAADQGGTGAANTTNIGDGPALMKGIAKTLGVSVTASSDTQTFRTIYISDPISRLMGNKPRTRFDFGKWEGDVFTFKSDGTSHRAF